MHHFQIRTRDAAVVAALVSVLVIWWAWGALNPRPIIADEQSYVLQARIFASGHWTAPAPPIREFFEQSVVLTAPAVASKYPPGHALLLSLGELLGSVLLMPLVLTGITGALMFLLVRRIANDWVAALTVLFWLSDPINLRFRPSFYSEITTQAMWLVALWSLLEWRQSRRLGWMLALSAAIGWGAITRPLTMLAFAVPVGFVVIRDVIRLRAWRDLAAGVALGIAVLGIIPLWSAQTTGDWKLTPLAAYHRDYLPYDKPGFGVDSTLPARKLNPVNLFTFSEFFGEHERHTLSSLPKDAWDRLREIAVEEWSGARVVLVPFVLLGLTAMSAEVVFALVCSVAVFVGYLSYGHFPQWTLYSFEAMPILALLAAVGVRRAVDLIEARRGSSKSPRVPLNGIATVLAVVLVVVESRDWRRQHQEQASWYTAFYEELALLPSEPTVIFVRYTEGLRPHALIVRNSPTLADDPVWIVNDMGARNAELMQVAGPRIPIIFHEDTRRFELDRGLMRDR